MNAFTKLFVKPFYEGEVVDIREKYRTDEKSAFDGVPTVYYDIYKHGERHSVGTIDLRLTIEGDMYYYGHIGYTIKKEHRGHNYAYHACKLIFNVAKEEFNMSEIIITCSPENIASYKTLKKLDGELIETVKVPKNHILHLIGETTKYVFRYRINL